LRAFQLFYVFIIVYDILELIDIKPNINTQFIYMFMKLIQIINFI